MVEYQRYRTFTIKLANIQDAIQLQNIQHLHNGDICIAGNFTQDLTTKYVQCCREIVSYLKQIDFTKTKEIAYVHFGDDHL
jgi:hypothetical protein